MKQLYIGTRGSQLALRQAAYIRDLLHTVQPHLEVDLKVISTRGDQVLDRALPQIGGKGLFTREIEDALLEEQIHLAVHSLKDLPSTLPAGLILAGTPVREDPRDAFLSQRWEGLDSVPERALIATGSIRRRTQVQALKPQATFVELRGNIDTRLKKLEDEDWDGIIMAVAALKRMQLDHLITEILDPLKFVPAVGQGALGIEIKASREDILELVENLNHPPTLRAVRAERAFMLKLEGGCSVPLGAWGREENGEFILTGYFSSPAGSGTYLKTVSGPPEEAQKLAHKLAEEFALQGVLDPA